MRISQSLRAFSAALVLTGGLSTCPGCGDDTPKTGTVVSPVDKDEAAAQNKAMNEFYKSKMPAKKK
jgi:hypothetical protein